MRKYLCSALKCQYEEDTRGVLCLLEALQNQWVLRRHLSTLYLHQAFFSFLAPHSHLDTMPSSFQQSPRVPRVTTSRNKKTSSRYCSCHGCCRPWGLRWAAPPVWRMWSIQPTSLWAGVRGWERLMMLAATAAALYLLADTEEGSYTCGLRSLRDLVSNTLSSTCTEDSVSRKSCGLTLPLFRWFH